MGPTQPFFSIVIPTYARPKQLASCLHSLTCLNYPRDHLEVIVVDDGSAIQLEPVVAPFRTQLDLLLVRQPNAGPARARNSGAEHAKGAFLAFTDDDCAPAPAWLHTLAARFAGTPDHMIGGRALNALPNNPYATTSQLMTDAVYAYYNDDPCQAHFFTTNNLAVPADRFRAIGGFDTTFPLAASEDREFCDRWLRHGYQMTYAPEALVYHAHVLTFRSFWRQHFKYGRGAFHFHQVRARRGWGRIKVDPKFYLHLFGYPFSRVHSGRAMLCEALLLLSYAAYTAGFWWERVSRINRRSAGKWQQA
jgi:GT2 family glycosyltransferase